MLPRMPPVPVYTLQEECVGPQHLRLAFLLTLFSSVPTCNVVFFLLLLHQTCKQHGTDPLWPLPAFPTNVTHRLFFFFSFPKRSHFLCHSAHC